MPPQNPLNLLHGVYATSYMSHIYMQSPAASPTGVPQVAAYQPGPNPGGFTQVSGYRLASIAIFLDFDGNGGVTGGGTVNRGGYASAVKVFTGIYTVSSTAPMQGTFTTVEQAGTPNAFQYEHYWIMSDNWKRLEFIVLHGNPNGNPVGKPFEHDQIGAGTLTKV